MLDPHFSTQNFPHLVLIGVIIWFIQVSLATALWTRRTTFSKTAAVAGTSLITCGHLWAVVMIMEVCRSAFWRRSSWTISLTWKWNSTWTMGWRYPWRQGWTVWGKRRTYQENKVEMIYIACPSIRVPLTFFRQVKVKNQTFITQECCSAIAYTVHQSRALTTFMTASVSW